MDKIMEEFLSITQQLDQCAQRHNVLKQQAEYLKANFNNTEEQKVILMMLEKEFEQLNKTTLALKQKAAMLKDRKPE